MVKIDLNCDLGEGGSFDAQLMPHLSSCNIACGGHAGNRQTMAKTVELALKEHVKIGAHPSYPDPENFGRKSMDLTGSALKETLKKQVASLVEIVDRNGGKLHHIKPHGALYNDLVHDAEKASVLVELMEEIVPKAILFVPPKSRIGELAQGRLKTWTEAFADRAYNPDFSLVSRQKEGAVLTRKEAILERVYQVASQKKLKAVDGSWLEADFDTLCLHSDTENAVDILLYLVEELPKMGIQIR